MNLNKLLTLLIYLTLLYVTNGNNVLPQLQYNILSKGQAIKIPLDTYFPFSSDFSILINESTSQIQQILDFQFQTNKTKSQISQEMVGLIDDKEIRLKDYKIIDALTIYNQPNKIFLLDSNFIMMYSYRQKSQQGYSKQQSTFQEDFPKVTVVNISSQALKYGKITNLTCIEIQTQPLQNFNKLLVLCNSTLKTPRTYLIAFNLQQNNRGFITHITYNSSDYLENKNLGHTSLLGWLRRETAPSMPCQFYAMKFFQALVVEQKPYNSVVIVYCKKGNAETNLREIYQVHFRAKVMQFLIISNPNYLPIYDCLLNSNYITQYQNGFVSVISPYIFKYSSRLVRNKYIPSCQSLISQSVYNYSFITSRNNSGIQLIYVIFETKIFILQSYSPNYQTLGLPTVPNSKLISYSISTNVLSLHYEIKSVENQPKKIIINAYDILTIYPHLIQKVEMDLVEGQEVYLFSVMNYLQKASYFFIYQRQTNLLNLTYYQGQMLVVNIKDPAKAIGQLNFKIVNQKQTSIVQSFKDEDDNSTILPILMRVKCFSDTSIDTFPTKSLKVSSKVFSISLGQSVIGPLGRFYKMSNPRSQLQFVNSFNQIQITQILSTFPGKKLLTFSVNTFLKDPILTFYFQSYLILNCDLQFDYQLMRPMVTRCVQVTDTETLDNTPEQIIIFQQGRFIQHQGHRISFCQVSTTTPDTICIEGDFQQQLIQKIKLIKFQMLNQDKMFLSVIIIGLHSFKQKDYIFPSNMSLKSQLLTCQNMFITPQQIPQLLTMNIQTVQFDPFYTSFLLLSLQSTSQTTPQSIIQIYSKPLLEGNKSSHFVGHLIKEIRQEQINGVFVFDTKVILLRNQGAQSQIQEYQVIDFMCTIARIYPIYGYTIVKKGRHQLDSGFLFVQVVDPQTQSYKYLVYNPSMNTTNVMTHSFQKNANKQLIFGQKIKASPNVMAINGPNLITLSLPSLVIKLNDQRKYLNHFDHVVPVASNVHQVQEPSYTSSPNTVNVSFIDSNDVLKILSYTFIYDISDSIIQYNPLDNEISFNSVNQTYNLGIQPKEIKGPVQEYSIKRQQQAPKICQAVKYYQSDIFVKTKCLKYFNSKEDGAMQDFQTYQQGLFNAFTIIVTQTKILCVEQMQISSFIIKNRTKSCEIFQSQPYSFIICDVNTQNSLLTTIQVLVQSDLSSHCSFNLLTLAPPSFLKYKQFKLAISNNTAIFQVPIRSQYNKVYYVTQFDPNTRKFDQNYSILKHMAQEQFRTKDFATHGELMFLLENGIGIYNLTKRNQQTKKNSPDYWITQQNLRDLLKTNEELIYINFLQFQSQGGKLVLQIGTTMHSYQVQLMYKIVNQSIQIASLLIYYTYLNPLSCENSLLSISRTYQQTTIKLCSFNSSTQSIFSQFIPISQSTPNSYLIFFQKSPQSQSSYPFRMQIIYTNIMSNDNFQLTKNGLIIGSLFGLMCFYQLRNEYSWQFYVDEKKFNALSSQQQALNSKGQYYYTQLQQLINNVTCTFVLNLSNYNYQYLYPIDIHLNLFPQEDQFWTDFKFWIQRIIFLIILFNYSRIQYVRRRQNQSEVNRSKSKKTISDSFDHEFQVQVKFLTKKSL